MFILDSQEALAQPSPPAILVAEGYATAASLHMATGLPVAVAFDAYNLLAAGEKLRGLYPQTELTFCADNDHQKEQNVGVMKAQEAAKGVGGLVIVPQFTEGEMGHGMAGPTDFNDLHQLRGLEGLKAAVAQGLEQARPAVEREAPEMDQGLGR